jgi:hypothetical protein
MEPEGWAHQTVQNTDCFHDGEKREEDDLNQKETRGAYRGGASDRVQVIEIDFQTSYITG